jgi:hypothetical protein
MAQETLIRASVVPFIFVRAAQFFEFVGGIAQEGSVGQTVRLAPPVNGMIEIAGPERIGVDDLVGRYFRATNDPREIVTDIHAHFFGMELNDRSLTPGENPRIGLTRFDDWLSQSTGRK